MNSHSTETRQQVSMDRHESNHQANHQFRRLPKGERRVRFADSMGMELVSIFLFDLISNYYFASIHNHQKLPPPPPPKGSISLAPPEDQQSRQRQVQQQQQAQKLHISPALVQQSQQQQQQQQPGKTISPTILASSNHYHHTSQNHNHLLLHHNHLQQNHHQQVHSKQQQQSHSLQAAQPVNVTASSAPANSHQDHQAATPSFTCDFTQPISLISFKERVKLNKVHLETCSISSRAGNTSISCTIRVLNQSYDKLVTVRYTTDEWHTYTDISASYVPSSCDGWSDKFTTTFSVTNQVNQFQTGQRIIFCVRTIYDGDKVFWDNNGGLNYTLKKV